MKNKNIRLALCLSAMVLAVLLGGCREKTTGGDVSPADQPSIPTEDNGPLISLTTTPTTEPPLQFTEPTEPTEETTPPPSLEPVTRLSSIKWRTVPQLLSLGDGTVLASRNY